MLLVQLATFLLNHYQVKNSQSKIIIQLEMTIYFNNIYEKPVKKNLINWLILLY